VKSEKQTQFKPNLIRRRRIEKNEFKLFYNKGLQKKRCFRSPKKTNPIKACPERSRMGAE